MTCFEPKTLTDQNPRFMTFCVVSRLQKMYVGEVSFTHHLEWRTSTFVGNILVLLRAGAKDS